MRARVHRKSVTESPFYIKDIHSTVIYDDDDQPLFAFYSDLGGLIKYAFAQDDDFEEIVRLAAGYTPTNIPEISNLNLSNVENPGPLR